MTDQKAKREQVIITGATGFIGQALSLYLIGKGYWVMVLSRNPALCDPESGGQKAFKRWNPKKIDGWEEVLENTGVVINLAGANIGTWPWTKRIKNLILNSRVQASRTLVEALLATGNKPHTFIQISGIGYYGTREDELLDENSSSGQGFLAMVSREWESSTAEVEKSGIRRIICRTGMVLGPDGAALKRLLLPFRLFLGGTIGTGNQWISWIHRTDVCRAIDFLISHPQLKGILNLSAPQPVTNREWTRTVAKILKKPAFLNIPAWVVKILLGEMGEELLLASQRVIPGKLLEAGFEFEFPHLADGLREILG